MAIKTTFRGGDDSWHENGRWDNPHPKTPGFPDLPNTNTNAWKDRWDGHPSLDDNWDGIGKNAIWEELPNGKVKNRISGETSWQ